jgi:hypothetical protein
MLKRRSALHQEVGMARGSAVMTSAVEDTSDTDLMIPVHQEGLSVHEKILRHFDLSNQYGVSYDV